MPFRVRLVTLEISQERIAHRQQIPSVGYHRVSCDAVTCDRLCLTVAGRWRDTQSKKNDNPFREMRIESKLTSEKVAGAIRNEAAREGFEITKRGRSALLGAVGRELAKRPADELFPAGTGSMEKAAESFLDYAKGLGVFKDRTRIGVLVVEITVSALRTEHAKTGVCAVWPFC
jgi:hypothetical protein